MATSSTFKLDTKGFNINLQFQNNLPMAYGQGSYAKIDLTEFNPEDSLRQGRRTSSLEKKYVWEACANPFCGMNINLLDQERLLRHTTEPLEPADAKIVFSQKKNTGSLGNNGARGVKEEQKPYWLRNTTYLENNPFNKYSNPNEEDTFQVHRESRKRQIEEDVFDKIRVSQSFSKCEEVIKSDNGPKKRRKVVNVFPLVPDTLAASSMSIALVRFDEDLRTHLASKSHPHLDADSQPHHTMITNVREPVSKEGGVKSNVFHATVVVPVAAADMDEEAPEKQYSHKWFRDFRMEMQDANLEDSYVLVLDATDKTAKYLPVRSRTDMKRLDFQQAVPRDVNVVVDAHSQ